MTTKKPAKEMKLVEASSVRAWRSWLKKNHTTESAAWLIYYKPGAPKTGIDYESSVEEALCFGWIDSTIRRLDEHRYVRQFTPRNKKSNWSIPNRKRVQKLLAEGKMTDVGLALLPHDIHDTSKLQKKPHPPLEIPADLTNALAKNKTAQKNFERYPPSHKRQYIYWINYAKREETRKKRIAETVRRCAANIKTML